jgi:hypothetical protein
MQDDFSLSITVTPPERAVDEHAPTQPFLRPALPGVDLSRADEARRERRMRAYRRIAWARKLLRRFNFDPGA